MIQFLKNIWYAQRNAALLKVWHEAADEWKSEAFNNVDEVHGYRVALDEIASGNPKNTNGTVRKHIRIARKTLGWEE